MHSRRIRVSLPIPLRRDFNTARLRGLAKKAKDGPQARRLLTLAAIYDGAPRSEVAKIGSVGLAGGTRRIAIVAMARKLLIALWRYVETGVVPASTEIRA